jgi:hypothetical protein
MCIFNCVHPIMGSGGHGACLITQSGRDYCQCDASGYHSTNGLGEPSCVSNRQTHIVYAVILAASVLCTAHGLFHLLRQKKFLSSNDSHADKLSVQDILRFRLPILEMVWGLTTGLFFLIDWAARPPFQVMFPIFFPTQVKCLQYFSTLSTCIMMARASVPDLAFGAYLITV